MRSAETILSILRQRGQRGLPVKDAYRLLYQRDLYLRAYGKLYRNAGALTPGATRETVDGMSLEKIDAIIEALRHERYRWTPVRRTYIPKKKTLVVCRVCHERIHSGQYDGKTVRRRDYWRAT